MNKKGFTLVELIVSITLVSIITIFLFQIIYIMRDIYAEKTVKSELYIQTSNISNIINKSIVNKYEDGYYITKVNKTDNNSLTISYSDNTNMIINIDRDNNTISYGDYNVKLLPKATIGNLDFYYNYDLNSLLNNGIAYIKIPVSYEDYNNDFSIIAYFRYDSTKTQMKG